MDWVIGETARSRAGVGEMNCAEEEGVSCEGARGRNAEEQYRGDSRVSDTDRFAEALRVVGQIRTADGVLPVLALEHFQAAERAGLYLLVKKGNGNGDAAEGEARGKLVVAEGVAVAIVPYRGDEKETRMAAVHQIARHILNRHPGSPVKLDEHDELVAVEFTPEDLRAISELAAQIVEDSRDEE